MSLVETIYPVDKQKCKNDNIWMGKKNLEEPICSLINSTYFSDDGVAKNSEKTEISIGKNVEVMFKYTGLRKNIQRISRLKNAAMKHKTNNYCEKPSDSNLKQ